MTVQGLFVWTRGRTRLQVVKVLVTTAKQIRIWSLVLLNKGKEIKIETKNTRMIVRKLIYLANWNSRK